MKIRLEIEGTNACSINYKGPECIDLAVAYLNSIEADEVQIHLVRDDGTRADAEFEGEFPVISAMKFILAASKTGTVVPPPITNKISETKTLTLKERLE